MTTVQNATFYSLVLHFLHPSFSAPKHVSLTSALAVGSTKLAKRKLPCLDALQLCSALPRSGMLPGYVAGWYSFDDCHVDLGRLARFARARLVLAPAIGLDLQVRWPSGQCFRV